METKKQTKKQNETEMNLNEMNGKILRENSMIDEKLLQNMISKLLSFMSDKELEEFKAWLAKARKEI